MKDHDLTAYMQSGIRKLVSDALKTTIKNPRETAFLLRYSLSSARAARRRKKNEKAGVHIPAFLIASIASECNLFCAGCYARANHMCEEKPPKEAASSRKTALSKEAAAPGEAAPPPAASACGGQAGEMLPDLRWAELFDEACQLGISFILLAGGEPLLHREILCQAAKRKDVIFPVFTNGTLLDDEYIHLLSLNRNLIPVISLEGDRARTDSRRGAGTYEIVERTMDRLYQRQLLYGTSITVTSENLEEVSSDAFIASLHAKGCRIVFFIEYVPVADGTMNLTLSGEGSLLLEKRLSMLSNRFRDVMLLSFPGDEKYMGGCLAAGRGFFHINPYGNAEPCPFSPFSDTSMKTNSIMDALKSPLFLRIKEAGLHGEEHAGGCSLFVHEEEVRAMLR
jgi:MoaA/NifB/PqqE/SkfB family radical SAM enzyme